MDGYKVVFFIREMVRCHPFNCTSLFLISHSRNCSFSRKWFTGLELYLLQVTCKLQQAASWCPRIKNIFVISRPNYPDLPEFVLIQESSKYIYLSVDSSVMKCELNLNKTWPKRRLCFLSLAMALFKNPICKNRQSFLISKQMCGHHNNSAMLTSTIKNPSFLCHKHGGRHLI